ncbi:pyridoxal-phosphate-dependent aminotransferase family protein [Ferviditalea candida]|uniref:Alanine--glyoxylate aminotransferase family protein n=1 Tax=Ferviditalea candida TaxID=3108399 RepID=A0ABU5ZMT5_9BACL|nr:alanine--glyoxylate aminotransferase family protein [Paenibacillaceae bacterium T2]
MSNPFKPSQRLLLGPGPSEVYPTVLEQMSKPLLGHLDPEFLKLMDELKLMLQQVFETGNPLTLAMPGTGSAGMETVFVNLIEPGDKVIICVNGVFGGRMADVAERAGAEVISLQQTWGDVFAPEQIEEALKKHPDASMVALVHAETSTGAWQPLQEIADLVHRHDKLFVVDTVTSFGGVRVAVDQIGIDAAYSGTQKCLSAPPGLAPVTFGQRALNKIDQRKHKVQSWYLDLTMIRNYWGEDRFYHHTAPITMNYALHEALRILLEEGLDNSFQRHALHGKALQTGLQAMKLKLVVEEKHRLPMLTTVYVPDGIEDMAIRQSLLNRHQIEIGGGLGPFKGKAWRIGLMGYGSSRENVLRVLEALESSLLDQGFSLKQGAAAEAALQVYHAAVI